MQSLSAKSLLFDLDGTLIDSTISIHYHWNNWANSVGIVDLDFSPFHGVQRPDIIKTLLPHLSDEEIASHAETVRIAEATDTTGVVVLPGAHDLLTSIPTDRWAIVTACDLETAHARLKAADLPIPDVLVNADDLDRGKPDPQGYLLGASRLGFDPADCIVFEDAPAGLEAAEKAGMRSVAFRTTAMNDEVLSKAMVITDSPELVKVVKNGDQLTVSFF